MEDTNDPDATGNTDDDGNAPGGTGDTSEETRIVERARDLLTKGGALESTGGGETIDPTSLIDALARRAAEALASDPIPPSEDAKAIAEEALAHAERALNKTSSLTDVELASLEAIIEVTGRPAMRFDGSRVRTPESALGENRHWTALLLIHRSRVEAASARVGRITGVGDGGITLPIGTGWRLGGDLVVTNRHVVELVVVDHTAPVSSWTLDPARRTAVDFAATDGAPAAARFDIDSLVYCAERGDVDIAILRVTSGLEALPRALKLDWDPRTVGREIDVAEGETRFQGKKVYVVGHPYRLRNSDAIAAVFGTADGLKRWSPGFVVRLGPDGQTFEHDCSTLGGNSGSCVLAAETHAVIGIHFGGAGVNELTGLGRANLALALSRLEPHPVAEILRAGRVPGIGGIT